MRQRRWLSALPAATPTAIQHCLAVHDDTRRGVQAPLMLAACRPVGYRRALTGHQSCSRIDGGRVDPYLALPLLGIRAGERQTGLKRMVSMSKEDLQRFKAQLTEKRDEIVRRAEQTLRQDMTLDSDDLPDEMDLASSEYLQAFTFRLRGREKNLLDKIQKALDRLDNGTFGICEECDEEISMKRLEARPETTLCIRCKEEQERVERDFG